MKLTLRRHDGLAARVAALEAKVVEQRLLLEQTGETLESIWEAIVPLGSVVQTHQSFLMAFIKAVPNSEAKPTGGEQEAAP
jgi:hypothetical protein